MKKIFIPILFIFSLISFSKEWAKPINTDLNFYQIDKNVYRSQQLESSEADLLKKLEIKTIINLRYFSPNHDKQNFGTSDFKLINIPLITWSISNDEIAKVLYTIEKEKKNGGVLIHCYHGSDRTGLISGMYRIIYQNWTIEEAKYELKNGPYGYHAIWFNILNTFKEDNIKDIKKEIELLRRIG